MFILQDVVNFKMFIYACKYIRKNKIQKEKAHKCFQKDYMLQEFFYLQIQIEEKTIQNDKFKKYQHKTVLK